MDFLIRDIQKGQKRAFKTLFEMHYKALCVFAGRYVNESMIQEDIVQDVFLSFWEKRTDFNHLLAIKSFLYASVRNKCLNHLKHENVKLRNEKFIVEDYEKDQEYVEGVITEETFNALYHEIKNLPLAAQNVMILALNGLRNEQIAEELNVSINTVKSYKKQSYKKIKHKLDPFLQMVLFFF